MKTFSILISFLLLLAGAINAQAEKIVIGGLDGIDPNDNSKHNRIVLALSGGGARGLASIGIIQAFEEKGLEISAIAGTSMGGIIGGLYASGYSPEELSKIVKEIDFNDFFVDAPRRQTMFLTQRQDFERHLLSIRFRNFRPVIPQGWTRGQKITAVLNRLTTNANYRCNGDFSKLPIPFKTVATDVVSGKEIILESGSISEAMRATMAFPLALTGVERDNQLLMDGGMVTPIPVEIAQSMNDSGYPVVAINTSSKLESKENLRNPVDIAGQVTTIMTADKLEVQLSKADYVIEPDISEFEGADFQFRDSIIAAGYRSGLIAADEILSKLASTSDTSKMFISRVTVESNNGSLQNNLSKMLSNKLTTKARLIEALKSISRDNRLFQLDAELKHTGDSKQRADAVELHIKTYNHVNTRDFSFRIENGTVYEPDTLIKLFSQDKEELNSRDFKNGLNKIEERYKTDDYDIAFVRDVDIDFESKQVVITLDEAKIKSIDIEDNERCRDWLVRSYFPLETGRPYSTERASVGIDNIYGTNLFEQAIVDLVPYRDGARVKIRVKERDYTQMRLGWHWDDDYKSEQYVELLDDNINGMGLEFLLHAQYAENRQKYYGQLKLDRIWLSYITAKITGYHNRLNRYVYDGRGRQTDTRKERKSGLEFSLGQQVQRFGTVRGSLIFEKDKNRYVETGLIEEYEQRIIQFESEIETFDRIPFTNSGKKHRIEVRFAGEFFGGETEYTRFFSSLEGFIPIGSFVNYHPKFSIGISGSVLPLSEQFYIGGAKSFVGYRAYEFAGDKVILLNNEIRFKLPLSFYLIGRYDIGEVYEQTDQIKLRNLRHGGGAFLAYDSPLGPFEIGYGAASFDNDRFYVNLGLSF